MTTGTRLRESKKKIFRDETPERLHASDVVDTQSM